MQGLFRRAWCHDQSDKKEKALLSNSTMRPSSLLHVTPLLKMKRKRSESPGEDDASLMQRDSKRSKLSNLGRQTPIQSQDTSPHTQSNAAYIGRSVANSLERPAGGVTNPQKANVSDDQYSDGDRKPLDTESKPSSIDSVHPPHTKADDSTATQPQQSELCQIIEHQFNLEILLKHRELRLIEQELAKCQVALEQLRRCEVVPYPGSTGLSQAISDGVGPSIKAQAGFTQPQAPAPWGVTDGPYTRHYARWLLNDPTFDSMSIHPAQSTTDNFQAVTEGRSTRNSTVSSSRTNKHRPSRDSVGNLNHALPNYPTQVRGKGGPLVIKRIADKKFVKLICNNCQRGDFSSVQGFLNHCRIAHKVDYKSHEAAATDCGRLLDEDEMHLIPQTAANVTPAPKAAHQRAPAPAAQVLDPPSVHPLNMQIVPHYTWKVQAAAARAAAARNMEAGVNEDASIPSRQTPKARNRSGSDVARGAANASAFHSSPLVASSSTPYLSSQFVRRGFGGNLAAVTTKAREKVDLGVESPDEEGVPAGTSRKQSVSRAPSTAPGARLVQTSTSSSMSRSHSQKGQHAPHSRPRPAPLAPPSSHATSLRSRDYGAEVPESPFDSHLSPHTADSNPGLVSDHEDDDGVSDLDEARSERHASPDEPITQLSSMRRGMGACGEAMDVDVEFEDDADGHHEVLIRPRGLAFQEFSQRSAGSTSARPVSRFGEAAK
ncbi:hypothetical protein AAFC00_002567 [Neodothiora populina]|uniref:AHC1-like C2H2 zinc-finger domain-containing protein n=1 Tax=Neodothiora populina TaxID=2781224 RepID=A0ABR3P7J0_9PEZI